MAQKRKAKEAFGSSAAPLSAFAAAKLARQSSTPNATLQAAHQDDAALSEIPLATIAGAEPYGDQRDEILPAEEILSLKTSNQAPVQLSSFEPTPSNVTQDDAQTIELVLQTDETITIVGEYDLSVMTGIVTIYGAVLRPSSERVRVFSPSTSALPQLQARQNNTIVKIFSAKSGLKKLEKLSPLFRNIWTPSITTSFELLGSSADDRLQRSLDFLDVSRETDGVLRTISARTSVEPRRPRIMTIGAKASGKSTFNRVLWNHLQSWTSTKKSHFLDIDPGQPEFSTPGLISLVEVAAPFLGPPFTHPAASITSTPKLIRSHAIAATSFKDNPRHYKECVLDLARHVDAQYPLIVNLCGWVTGEGASVLSELLAELQISDVVLLEPLDGGFAESLQQNSNLNLTFYRIPRRPPKPSSRTPAELRTMQTMALFHSRVHAHTGNLRWSGKAISRIRPWLVDYAGSKSGISAIMSYGQDPTAEFLAEVLNGSIVALTVVDEEEAEYVTEDLIRSPEDLPLVKPDAKGIPRTLSPSRSHCIGLALVRGIDTENKQIHLVTPLDDSQVAAIMTKRVVLVRGSFDSPEWAYLEDLYKDPAAVTDENRPWVSKRGLVGVEGAVWRLRHPPMANAVTTGR